MSRTADPSVCQRRAIFSLVLLMIAFCLSAHFLAGDFSLNQSVDSSTRGHSSAGLDFDEMEHQDDLAMAASLPEFILYNNPTVIPAWSIRLERQFAFPIYIPPKIASLSLY